MVAYRGRHIDIGIGVMQCVKAPQQRHRVLTAVHRVLQKIEQQEACDKAQPLVGDRPRRQRDAKSCLELEAESLRLRKGEAGEDDAEEPNAQIAEPPPQSGKLALPSRPEQFPSSDKNQATEDDSRGQRRLLLSGIPCPRPSLW